MSVIEMTKAMFVVGVPFEELVEIRTLEATVTRYFDNGTPYQTKKIGYLCGKEVDFDEHPHEWIETNLKLEVIESIDNEKYIVGKVIGEAEKGAIEIKSSDINHAQVVLKEVFEKLDFPIEIRLYLIQHDSS